MLYSFIVIKKYLLLEKSLNFAVTPDIIPHLEFVASVEKGLQNVKNVDSKITQILKNSKLPPKNITTAKVQMLKELRSDPTIKIMNSDKVDATVILDSNTYDKKMLDMLSQGWANFSYGGSHLKKCCNRGPHTLITK